MSEIARRLIAENLKTKYPYLDLYDCGLTDLNEVPELFECVHLETLILSNIWVEFENGIMGKKSTQNKGRANALKALPVGINELKNIKKFVYKGNIHDTNSQITDISSLQGLTSLTDLDLSINQITDISFLQGLTALTNLDLSENQITDISFLQGLTALTNLELGDNQITDISSLQGLTALTNLDLRNICNLVIT